MWDKTTRIWRAIAAMIFAGVLIGALLFLEGTGRKEAAQRTYDLSILAWNVNETLFESQRLQIEILKYKDGTATHDELVLAAELLWSRLGIISDSKFSQYNGLNEVVSSYFDYLSRYEPVIYDQKELTKSQVGEVLAELDVLTENLRNVWIGEFLQKHRVIINAAVQEQSQNQTLLKFFIVVSILALACYIIIEFSSAYRSASTERSLRKQATSANAAKSAFIANVSHEIRTPLNGVIGMAQELSESPLCPDQKNQVDVILSSGELLLSTINDVLDLSKVESSQMVLEKRLFDPEKYLRQSIELHLPIVRTKGLVLNFVIDGELPSFATGDPMRLTQVINNLLSNALKFTDSGSVRMLARASEASADNECMLTIEVSDTGPGIAPGAISHIFQPFSQADSTTTRKYGGTGLGLTISKAICNAMGGDLSVNSKPGAGSTFTARVYLSGVKEDWHLPASPQAQPPAPSQDRSPDNPQNAGCGDGPAGLAAKKDLRILLADDSSTNRKVAKLFIAPRCRRLFEAATGTEAVAAAAAEVFDVILMDIQMPEMDGIEATVRIREHERRSRIRPVPIIALTANAMPQQIESYLAHGVNQVVTKPIRKAELLDILETISPKQAS